MRNKAYDLEAVAEFLLSSEEERNPIIFTLMAMGVIKWAWIAIKEGPRELPWLK